MNKENDINMESIAWELNNKKIIGHTFEGDGVYIIKRQHQKDCKYVLFWRDNSDIELIKLQESDHLLSIMNYAVKHWGVK